MQTETVAKVVSEKVKECKAKGKKQSEISIQAGFKSANMITHIKQGKSKLPPEKAPALAKALDIDEEYLLRLALNEKWEGVGDFIFSNRGHFIADEKIEKMSRNVLSAFDLNYDLLSEDKKENLQMDIRNFISKKYSS